MPQSKDSTNKKHLEEGDPTVMTTYSESGLESVYLEASELYSQTWVPSVLVASGFGILLSLYMRSSNASFHASFASSETGESLVDEVGILASTKLEDYLRHVERHYAQITHIAELKCPPLSKGEPEGLPMLHLRAPDGILQSGLDNPRLPTLHVQCSSSGSNIALSMMPGTSLKTRATAARFLAQLSHVTKQLPQAAAAGGTLYALDFTSHIDRRDLLRWNHNRLSDSALCVHDVFHQRASECSKSPAVCSWDGGLSYTDLETLSSTLSAQLLEEGVHPGECVPICIEKSRWVVVAMLAVLKSGCCFFLMDTSFPDNRLRLLARALGPSIVLTSEAQRSRATSLAQKILVVSSVSVRSPAPNKLPNTLPVSPNDLAVVVFTSGTTGKPKSIAIEHRSVCSALMGLAKVSGLGKRTRFYQFSSYAFDAAYGEILSTLMSGGCVCIPSDEDRLGRLADSIRSLQANTAFFTPTVLRLLSQKDVPCLDTMLTGGERITKDIIMTWGTKLNLTGIYAPAECTVACVAKGSLASREEASLLGTPFGCRTWIGLVDCPARLAPIGVTGELFIEGPNVARGYLDNNLETTKSFLEALPWGKAWESSFTSCERVYRTGDLVYHNEDGELIFVGRRDRQIKYHGQRLELEELEGILQGHIQLPRAQIIVDLLQLSEHGAATLAAFLYLPAVDSTPQRRANSGDVQALLTRESERLRNQIVKEVPSFMVPTFWLPLEEVPLSSTGKLDRHELTRLGKTRLDHLRNLDLVKYSLTDAELRLSDMWNQVLRLPAHCLPLDAHFFLLGGDSIKAMELVALAVQSGWRLSVQTIFKHPTLSEMAFASRIDLAVTKSLPVAPFSLLGGHDTSKALFRLADIPIGWEQVVDMLPATPLQQGLFSQSMLVPTLYTSQFCISLPPALDINAFRVAWERTMLDLPILRTRLMLIASGFVQVVVEDEFEWTIQETDLKSFLAQERKVVFEVGQRLAGYVLIEDESSKQKYMVWTLHHAIFDAWSLSAILDYVRCHYENRKTPHHQPFQDFVQFCVRNHGDAAYQFWRSHLANAPIPSFPKFPSKNYQSMDRSCLTYTMESLRRDGLTFSFTTVARAAWALLLSQYEGSDDVVFGNTLHGRNSCPPSIQDVVGPTITTLPIRVTIDRTHTVSEFCEMVQQIFIDMVPFEQFGLSKIRSIDQDTHAAASFRTLLIVQDSNGLPFLPGAEVQEIGRCLHEYPLVISLVPERTRVVCTCTFDEVVIPELQARRMLEQYEQTFQQLLSRSQATKINDLDLASEPDEASILRGNVTPALSTRESFHGMFQKWVKGDPEGLAVYACDGSLEYGDLDQLSTSLAYDLLETGVVTNQLIGLCFEKSQWAVVSMLAVIKAGAAFVPFSPDHPRARIEVIATENHIDLMLCSRHQFDLFRNGTWRTIKVDEGMTERLNTAHEPWLNTLDPDRLLYALHTSGTTGSPKMFAVQEKSFASGAVARAPVLRRGPRSRVLQFAPFVFDPSIEDILTTLMFGGCVCLPSEDDILNDLSDFMKKARVNFANLTPSMAHTLRPDALPDLELLLLSGEPPDRVLVQRWEKRVELMNGYGPSECSIKCSINRHLSRDDPQNIGHAVGSNLWVVSPTNHNKLSPIGAIGELVIESPSLAKGYINRPSETAERFIRSPPWLRKLRNGSETTIYKTGDLVRYSMDGTITFIRRNDSQIKLFGQRFEAQEVERCVSECLPDKHFYVLVDICRFQDRHSDAVVCFFAQNRTTSRSQIEIDTSLEAYLADEKDSIVKRLSTILPSYMIPTVFLAISAIPVTANGKVDRRMLRTWTSQLQLGSARLEPSKGSLKLPTTEAEQQLHRLWQMILGLSPATIGTDDHFFLLGGSSVSAIRLVGAVRESGWSLPAPEIFHHPILSDMATRMRRADASTTPSEPEKYSLLKMIGSSTVELEHSLASYRILEEEVEDAYPCTRMQNHFMGNELLSPGSTTFQHAIPLPGDIDLSRLLEALELVVNHHAILRSRVIRLSSHLVQIVCRTGFFCERVEDLASALQSDRKYSWGLGDPLSRFKLVVGLRSKPQYLIWTSNHAMWDGWFRKLLMEEIDYVYHRGCLSSPKPGLNQFVKHVYEIDNSKAVGEQAGASDVHRLQDFFQQDHKRLPRVDREMELGVQLPVLKAKGTSTAAVILTAWIIVAAHVDGLEHFLTNVLVSGRDTPFHGLDILMGPTSSTVPLSLPRIPKTIGECVKAVHNRLLEIRSVQHALDLGEGLREALESAPRVAVYPAEEYEEMPTTHLRLVRKQFFLVSPTAYPLFMSFMLRTENLGVDLCLSYDASMFPRERALKYLSGLKFVLPHLFVPESLDLAVADIPWDPDVLCSIEAAVEHRELVFS
ncbi:putative nonribosomal peptide synthase [Lophiotrema nucula]|uniref:Putative nonribosomal peptide synthase n=1 Tax=Lophiotrema nucula TaxID=690887 RepID=A0A6A5YIP6_9PLEO|nr:putative nonribosomal peptide synthase [Lophiotrema nucula]